MKDDGGPAFPRPLSQIVGPNGPDLDSLALDQNGMSLRDHFATAALQGMLAYSHMNPSRGNYHENCTATGVAQAAYEFADAMLVARKA